METHTLFFFFFLGRLGTWVLVIHYLLVIPAWYYKADDLQLDSFEPKRVQ